MFQISELHIAYCFTKQIKYVNYTQKVEYILIDYDIIIGYGK